MSERKDQFEHDDGLDFAVEEARPKIKQPPLYRVVLINDDYTPMEFVVRLLMRFFQMPSDGSYRKGHSSCTLYSNGQLFPVSHREHRA